MGAQFKSFLTSNRIQSDECSKILQLSFFSNVKQLCIVSSKKMIDKMNRVTFVFFLRCKNMDNPIHNSS